MTRNAVGLAHPPSAAGDATNPTQPNPTPHTFLANQPLPKDPGGLPCQRASWRLRRQRWGRRRHKGGQRARRETWSLPPPAPRQRRSQTLPGPQSAPPFGCPPIHMYNRGQQGACHCVSACGTTQPPPPFSSSPSNHARGGPRYRQLRRQRSAAAVPRRVPGRRRPPAT